MLKKKNKNWNDFFFGVIMDANLNTIEYSSIKYYKGLSNRAYYLASEEKRKKKGCNAAYTI